MQGKRRAAPSAEKTKVEFFIDRINHTHGRVGPKDPAQRTATLTLHLLKRDSSRFPPSCSMITKRFYVETTSPTPSLFTQFLETNSLLQIYKEIG